ncbi:MAG TPA: biliverdin-producing heme oxygenase [Allosphingosinicella sp.]
MSARAALRAATSEDHERVDRLFSRFDLGSPDGYRLFLTAQAAAHVPIEAALDAAGAEALLPDWRARRRSHLIEADLAELGCTLPDPVELPVLADTAAIMGALYVLEGSRLGGAVLKRELAPHAPMRFLAAEQAPGAWRKLLAKLDESLYQPALVEAASQTARLVFRRFEIAARRHLESAQA